VAVASRVRGPVASRSRGLVASRPSQQWGLWRRPHGRAAAVGGGATVRRGLDNGRAKRPEGGGWAKVCMAVGV
jgi:hypothetical protein